MRFSMLGRTDLRVSALGFGAAPLGQEYGAVSVAEGERAVAAAIDAGINLFDVSPYYGRTLAEERLGRALTGRRDEVVLVTKVGRYGPTLPDGFDFSACGGTHPRSAGEVGVIVTRRWERYKGGSRVEFLCGGRALRDYEQQNAVGWELNRLLSVAVPELPQAVARLQEQAAETRRGWEKARTALLEREADALWRDGEPLAGEGRLVRLNLGDRPMEEAKALAGSLCRHPLTVALLGTVSGGRAQLLFQRSADLTFDLNQVLRSVLPLLDGRGGGQPSVAQGGGPKAEALDEALRAAAEDVRHR